MIPPGNPPAAHHPSAPSSSPTTVAVDPHLWLEDVLGESQLAWVERCNARCLDDVGDPRGTDCYERIKDILDSKVRDEGFSPANVWPSGWNSIRCIKYSDFCAFGMQFAIS